MSYENPLTPPETFDPRYCEGVHAICNQRYSTLERMVHEVHDAIFGSKDHPGMLNLLTKKLSISSVKWVVTLLAVPMLLAFFAFYEFYIAAPFKYADTVTVHEMDSRVLRLEGAFNELPTAAMMKSIVKEAIKESQAPGPRNP